MFKWDLFISNILIHVGLMALFLTIFFFTIATYFEKRIIEDQVDFVIDDFVGNTLKPVSKDTKDKIKSKINNIFSKEDFSKSDDSVKKQNNDISNKAWTFVGILVGVITLIILIFGFIQKWKYDYIKLLFVSSFSSIIFVAITETLFLFLIAQNYLSADPNNIKLNIIETLSNNRCNPCDKKIQNCLGSNIANCPSPP